LKNQRPQCKQAFSRSNKIRYTDRTTIRISDNALYSLAVFLGSAAMLLIVLYHFLEINAKDSKDTSPLSAERRADALPAKAAR